MTTRDRIARAPSANTSRAYARWAKEWDTWCAAVGRCPLPATPETLAEFVSHLADEGKGVPTINMAVAAVRSLHATAGYEDQPAAKLARLALRTHAKEKADSGTRGGQATPILLEALRAMLDTCPPDSPRGLRDRLILLLGWAGMFRRSEMAALNLGDIAETPDGLTVYIARSKTDKDAKGSLVLLPRGSHPESDPVRAWQNWAGALADQGITTGRLLRSIGLGGRIGDDITSYGINDVVKVAAERAGLVGSYTAHSLRAGGATASYRNGATVSAIAEHGRWAKNSPVVLGYIRAVDKWKDNPMRGIGL